MARQPEGPPPPPAVQKFRLRYAKRDKLRFSSHRDFQRALERALRRCRVPMAYSAGFTPHPKISYAGAAPTGAASEAEYVEISVTQRCDPAAVRDALAAALPAGLTVVDVVEVRSPGTLADRLTGSIWRIVLPGTSPLQAQAAVNEFLAREQILVSRTTKRGRREVDVREPVIRLTVHPVPDGPEDEENPRDRSPCAILELVVRHTTPTVRPDDVLTALRDEAGLAPAVAPVATRLAQGLLDPETGDVADPLAADKELVGG